MANAEKGDNVTQIGAAAVKGTRRKKNCFRRLEKGAYREQFIHQVEANVRALSLDNLDYASMVSLDERNMMFRLVIGLGMKNEWFRNAYVPKGDYLEYASIPEAIETLKVLLKKANAGEFDDALDELRIKRQKHADKMVKIRRERFSPFASPTALPKAA